VKLILWALGGLAALLLIVLVAGLLLIRVNVKPRLQAIASDLLGLQVTIRGDSHIQIFPGLGVTVEDVHIGNAGREIASAQRVVLTVAFIPLLHKDIRIARVSVQHANIAIEHEVNGRFNFETLAPAGPRAGVDLQNLSIRDATVLYKDLRTGGGFAARSCTIDADQAQLSAGHSADVLRNLALSANFTCGEIRTKAITMTQVHFSAAGKDGVFEVKPLSMQWMRGQGGGELRADFTGALPQYRLHYSLSKFQIQDYFEFWSKPIAASGLMDFTADLSMHGKTLEEMKRSSAGEASLRGGNLVLQAGDMDREFAKYKASQKFSLIDVGAFFLVGPLGLAITKGYDFAGALHDSGGSTQIRAVVSRWTVNDGVATAQDVALVTPQNRIAMKGGLNFGAARFEDFTVALLNGKGCASVSQTIHGPFAKPEVDKPNVLEVLSGPARHLLNKAKHLLGGKCAVFYTGSLPQPPSQK
jgi:uncharacterized protein involved in outer membrane biogenesis